MSFIDKYYAIFNNSVGQHSVTISRAEFANLLGVFSKQEQQLDQLKAENEELKNKINSLICSENCYKYKQSEQLKSDNKHLNDLLDQALKELEESREAIEKVREIAESQIKAEENNKYKTNGYIVAFDILQICNEVNKDE